MARRDVLSHTVWLRRIAGESGDGRVAPSTGVLLDTDEELLRRINRMGYLVEFWVETDMLRARFYPISERLPLGQPPVSLSYSGAAIRPVLIAASLDLAALANHERRYEVATREHVRWAA